MTFHNIEREICHKSPQVTQLKEVSFYNNQRNICQKSPVADCAIRPNSGVAQIVDDARLVTSMSRSTIIVIIIVITIVIVIVSVFIVIVIGIAIALIVIVMNQYQQQVSWLVDLLIEPAVWDHTASVSCSKPPNNLSIKFKPKSFGHIWHLGLIWHLI